MLERRPLFVFLIVLTVCVSIWRISLQESSMMATEVSYSNSLQAQQGNYYHYRNYPQRAYQEQQQLQAQPPEAIRKQQLKYSHRSTQPRPPQTLTSSVWTLAIPTLSPPRQYTVGAENGGGTQWRARRIRNGDIKRPSNISPPSWSGSSNNKHNSSVNSVATHNSSLINYDLSSAGVPSSVLSYEALPKGDINSLIDLHDFEFIMNRISCASVQDAPRSGARSQSKHSNDDSVVELKSTNPFLLILVHSAPTNFQKRLLIRETWGSLEDPSTRLIFLLGAVNSTDLQQSLELENDMFSDMVQGNFIDAYRNMTYKHVMALKWFSYYCPEVKYILKIDDDVFVNTPYLLQYLQTSASRQDLLFCQKIDSSRVKRSYRSKWRVSTREYPGRYYPPYCPGYSIIYSPDVAYRLYVEAQKTPYFWIDDVHVTGTLSQHANISITTFAPFILKRPDCEDILAGKTDINNFVFLFSWPDIKENQTRSLWNLIRDIR